MVKRLFATVLILIGLTVSSVLSAEQSASTDATTGATKKSTVTLPADGPTWTVIGEVPGIKNFVVRYHDRLYRGGSILTKDGAWFLKQRGVTKVFSVTPDSTERAILSEVGIEIVEVPFAKENVPFEMFDKFITSASVHKGPLYVHCLGGKQRGGILSAAFRVKVEKATPDAALKEFYSLGGDATVDTALVRSLKDYLKASGKKR